MPASIDMQGTTTHAGAKRPSKRTWCVERIGFSSYLRPMSRRRVLIVCAVYLLVTVYFDWITGPSVSLTVFYVLPVGLLTWFMSRRSGYVLAVAASVLWFAIDLTGPYTLHSPLLYWNTAVRCGLMLVIAALVHACRQLTGEIEKLVTAKTASLQAEVAARQQAEDAMRALATRVSAAEDAERRRLAHDLHDAVGQDLTALRLTLEATTYNVQGNATGLARLHEACTIVDRVIQQTRGLTRDLIRRCSMILDWYRRCGAMPHNLVNGPGFRYLFQKRTSPIRCRAGG